LAHNFDLLIAAQRVEEARAQFGITRANQFPQVNLTAGFTSQRSSSIGSVPFISVGHGSEQFLHFGQRRARAQEEFLVHTLEDTVRLSELRYRGGLDSYLQVLDAQRNLFAGQLSLAQLRLQERVSVVQLYRALGGAWN
jgi:multidrug efflux system outer membrane protein